MAHEFRCKRRVEFSETDMARIVHFTHFFRYMEMAEHAFLRSLGLSVHTEIDGQTVSWPRLHAECSFRAPVVFEEEIEIHLLVREKTRSTITYEFRFIKEDGKQAAIGCVKVVCVAVDTATDKMTSIAMPSSIDEMIEQAPDELFKQNS